MNNLHEESRLSYYGWIVVAMAFLANLIAFGLVYSFSVFFKPLSSDFGWSRAMTVGAFSAYAITHDVFAPFTGWLTDRFGPRVVATIGGLCLAGSMILMSHITTIWELYLYYAFLFGLGVAAVYAPMMATVSRWFTLKRGLAIGLTAAGLGAGSLGLSPLVAWLISSYGWRTAYVFVGAMAFTVFIPIVIFIKKSPMESYEVKSQMESIADFSFIDALRTRALWALSFGGWAGVIAAFPADYFGLKATGAIFGFVVIMAGVGVAIGSFMGGHIFDITHSYNYMKVMCILTTFVAIVFTSLMKTPKKVGLYA
jgi:MFS family permease